MRKILTLSAVVLLALPSAAHAAAIGRAKNLGQGNFAVSLEQEMLFGREMKDAEISMHSDTEGVGPNTHDLRLKSEIDQMYRSFARVSYGLLDDLDVFIRLGIAQFDAKLQDGTFADPLGSGVMSGSGKIKGKNVFAYGLGMKWVIPLEDDWLLGIDAQYLRHRNKSLSTMAYEYEYTSEPFIGQGGALEISGIGKVSFYEWHVAPYIAIDLGEIIPYLGVRYSDARIKDKTSGEGEFIFGETHLATEGKAVINSKTKNNIGIFAGIDILVANNFLINIEGRYFDETAASIGLTYKF